MKVDSSAAPLVGVAKDIVRRGLLILPVVCVAALLLGGSTVAVSVLLGVSMILVNFIVSAYILLWVSKCSPNLIVSMSVGGYFLRSAFVASSLWVAKDVEWVSLVTFGITLVVTHLGLLFWELRFISTTIAHPGLKPKIVGHLPAVGYGRKGCPDARA